MTILFRANSSSTIGTGHIMRDLVLSKQYIDHKIIFITQSLTGNINYKIEEAGYQIELVKDNSIEEFQKIVDKYNPELVIIDSYDIGYEYEKRLKIQNPKLQLLSFDDTYEKHYCDIVLNHNISADETRYEGLVPNHCEVRCGEKYTLFRDEFLEQKRTKTVFLAMGGADHSNINIDILEVLKDFDNIEVNLVTTTANQNLEALRIYVKDKEWIELHINSNQVARLMRISDFAIVTPSVTLNEVFFMELDFIAIETADNQDEMVQYLKQNRFPVLNSFNPKVLNDEINNILKPKRINFIDLSTLDKKMVLSWRNHPNVRQWMYTQDVISVDDHFTYIEMLKQKKDRAYFLIKERDRAIGVIDFTEIDFIHSKTTIGLYAKPNLRGVGRLLMDEVLDYAFNTLKISSLVSEVFNTNSTAIRLYREYGFQEINRRDNMLIMELNNENR